MSIEMKGVTASSVQVIMDAEEATLLENLDKLLRRLLEAQSETNEKLEMLELLE